VTRGHDAYFLPYDARVNDLYSSAFEMNEVTGILRRLNPERVVVLIDSCFSGAAGGRSIYDPRLKPERAPFSEEFLDDMAHAGKGRVVLTASGPDEPAEEDSDLGHGVFTYYLLKGLRGAADSTPPGERTPDGKITVSEIYNYLSREVPKATKSRQNPSLRSEIKGELLFTEDSTRPEPQDE
jgi:uncharacterized caspase-like protein